MSLAFFVWLVTSLLMVFGMALVNADRRTPIHAVPLMGARGVVALEVVIKYGPHLLNDLKPGAAFLNPDQCQYRWAGAARACYG